jgi:thiosulfate/3-mercaptopyruvate sulfurtransferase
MRLILLGIAAAAAWAAGWPGFLVSSDWLAGQLGRDDLIVLHAGTQKDFHEGHIPGARLVELADISITREDGLRTELPPVDQLRETFSRLGISDDSHVVIYAGTSSFQTAARIFFTLDYLGLGNRIALLDGGLALWRAEGRPLSTEAALARRGTLAPRPAPERVVDAAWIQQHGGSPGVVVIDARAPQFYSGADPGPMPRAGHIPGARNLPYTALVDGQGRFKSRDEIAALLSQAGAQPGSTVVSYCHVGHQASAIYFAARYAGFDARLYDGSFQDWSRRPELAVEVSGTTAPGSK